MQHLAAVVGAALPIDAPATKRPASHVRDRRRAQAWHLATGRLTGHRLEHASTPEEVARIESDHVAEVEAGPAFAKVRRRSGDETPIACTDRNELVRILVLFGQIEAECFRRDRAWADHEGRRIRRTISRTVRPVLAALVGLARRHAQVFPSLERIASLAGCCRRTVTSALAMLDAMGLVVRHRRRKRISTPYGARMTQATSAFVLVLPTETASQIAARLDRGESPPPRPRFQKANLAQLFNERPEYPEKSAAVGPIIAETAPYIATIVARRGQATAPGEAIRAWATRK
jgi:hypothetical protein